MVTADVVTAYFNGQVGLIGLSFTLSLLTIFFIAMIALVLCTPRKSKNYRKLVSDMYVAGKIRQFADEDKIDLEKEEVKFKSWLKKSKIADKDLDETVVEDLKDRVASNTYEKSSKTK